MRLVDIAKVQSGEKTLTDQQLHNARRRGHSYSGAGGALAGYNGVLALQYARKARDAEPRAAKNHKMAALSLGGLAGTSAAVAGYQYKKARNAERALRDRGVPLETWSMKRNRGDRT
jgi:hypothetical protein